MVYILMIYADEADWTTKSEAEMAPVMAAHERLEQDLRKAGKYRGCGGLAPTSAATTVRLGAAASRSLPTAPTLKPRSSSAATTLSTRRIWMRRCRSPRASRAWASARSRSGPVLDFPT